MSNATTFRRVPDALLDACVSAQALACWCWLARRANTAGRSCRPHRATLARQMQCSTKTVDRALAELREAGFLRSWRSRKGNHYALDFDHDGTPVSTLDGTRVSTPDGTPVSTTTGHRCPLPRDTGVPQNESPEREPMNEQQLQRRGDVLLTTGAPGRNRESGAPTPASALVAVAYCSAVARARGVAQLALGRSATDIVHAAFATLDLVGIVEPPADLGRALFAFARHHDHWRRFAHDPLHLARRGIDELLADYRRSRDAPGDSLPQSFAAMVAAEQSDEPNAQEAER